MHALVERDVTPGEPFLVGNWRLRSINPWSERSGRPIEIGQTRSLVNDDVNFDRRRRR